ncbi:MAG: hypothetical protein ACE5FT_04780 [Candidatus Nanoarchaeia archaeon]
MVLSYRYKEIERPYPYPSSYAPAIPIIIGGPEYNLESFGLLDSGADFSAIPFDMAQTLGLDLNNEEEYVGGVGEDCKAVLTTMCIVINKGNQRYKLKLPVYAIRSHKDKIPVLLGRDTFFERFKITFDEREKKVILKPYTRKQ